MSRGTAGREREPRVPVQLVVFGRWVQLWEQAVNTVRNVPDGREEVKDHVQPPMAVLAPAPPATQHESWLAPYEV
jgi:hypothetical protein